MCNFIIIALCGLILFIVSAIVYLFTSCYREEFFRDIFWEHIWFLLFALGYNSWMLWFVIKMG